MFSIVLLFVFGVLLFYYWLWTSTFWSRRGIQGPNGMPVFGNMFNYLTGRKHYGYVYEDICKSFPDAAYIGMYRLFNEPAILLRSLDMIKEVMIKSFSSFHDNVLYIDEQRDSIIMCDPFVARGDKWRLMRNEIVPIFTPNKVKLSFHHINSICKKLETYLELTSGQSYEAKDLCSKYTLDVVTSAACGLSLADTKSDLTKLVENLFMPNPFSLFETTALLFVPMLGRLIKYRYIPIKIQNWLSTIVTQVLFERLDGRTNQNNQSDFIQWLIEAKQKANEPINEHIMTGHCATFLLEGFETSASLMTFALYQIATNIHVQNKVHEEVDRVMSKYNGQICYDAIMEMTYLEAALYETLRLYPPMLALLKQCTKPFELPPQYNGTQLREKVILKVGTVVIVPVKAIHYNPEIFPEPYEFNPERFTESNKRQRNNCAFLGFGEGPRMCPGMRFGLTQSKAGLVTILMKYWVVLSPNCKELKISTTTFLTSSKDGIWICLKPR